MIYEDAAVKATLPNPGAAIGHIHITSKADESALADLDVEEALQLFWTASFAATGVFETLGAQGSNIVLEEGEELKLDVYARNQGDNLGLGWEPQPGDKAEIESVAKTVADAFWYVGKEDSTPKPEETIHEPPEISQDQDDERIKHLSRRY